ncbi:hypothetical protein D9M69_604240 [compost metagenome]
MRLRLPEACAETANDETPAANAAAVSAQRIIIPPYDQRLHAAAFCKPVHSLCFLHLCVNLLL